MADANGTDALSSTKHAPSEAPLADQPVPTLWKQFKPLWPSVLGLAFARVGLTITCYGRYQRTDEGFFTDGSMLVALFFMGIVLLVMAARDLHVRKRPGNRIMHACIAVETLALVGVTIMQTSGTHDDTIHAALCILCSLAASWSMFYWLRRSRGTATATAAVLVFSALAVSELVLYVTMWLPFLAAGSLGTILVLSQLACMRWARGRTQAHDIDAPSAPATDFFGFAKTALQSRQFLAATAMGIGLLSIVIGFLRGFPDGDPIPFTPISRSVNLILTLAICGIMVWRVFKGHRHAMTTGIFVGLELLACLALIVYAAAPEQLDFGAIFATTLNALMAAFVWYIIIAFMGNGHRDPYYYALGGWIVFMGCRGTARISLLFVYPVAEANDTLMLALMGTLVVASAQVVFLQFLKIERQSVVGATTPTVVASTVPSAVQSGVVALPVMAPDDGEAPASETTRTPDAVSAAEPEEKPRESMLLKVMGLDDVESPADVRQRAVQHSAEQIGEQFLLSDREVEVLSLYALGYTQKRVAEELYISPGTAHAHIKRIYAKTGMHSRQEILDYMQQYTS